MKPITITVPATSANLGPGFDALGLALGLTDTVSVTFDEAGEETLAEHTGPECIQLDPRQNLLCRAYRRWGQERGVSLPGARFQVEAHIPSGRGLGASAAAIVAGLAAGAHACGEKEAQATMVRLATELEGHPDNCVAAILGGLTAGFRAGPEVHALPVVNHLLLDIALFVPHTPLPTVQARAVLPAEIPLADAVFNLGRTAYLVTALMWGRWELIGPAMEDRLHQPYRTPLIPALPAVIAAARQEGAYGAALSGGGPAVLALAPHGSGQVVAQAMDEAATRQGWEGRSLVTSMREFGVQVKEAENGAG